KALEVVSNYVAPMRPSEVTRAKFLTTVAGDIVRRSRGDCAHDPASPGRLQETVPVRSLRSLAITWKQSPPAALIVGEATLAEIAVDKDLDSKGQIMAERS